jgi:hypothetical protein
MVCIIIRMVYTTLNGYGLYHDIYHLANFYIPWYIPKVVYTISWWYIPWGNLPDDENSQRIAVTGSLATAWCDLDLHPAQCHGDRGYVTQWLRVSHGQ